MPALYCAAYQIPATAASKMMFMPGGLQVITPFGGGIGQPISVVVDAAGAAALEAQRAALLAKGKRPYFDFEHEDSGASFWPESFFWSNTPAPGIYAKGEWTARGKAGVEGKEWRQFSPVFHVDDKRAAQSHIVCNPSAKPNMGGLVNDPAFSNISPLWAKNASGAHPATNNNDMDPKQLEALQAKNTELTNEIAKLNGELTAIKAKGENTEFIAAKIELKETQLRETALNLANAALVAKNATAEAEILANRQANAKAAVQTAVERGAIAAKDADTIAQWEKDITADPSRAALLAKMQGAPAITSQRITTSGGTVITAESPNNVIKAFGAIIAKNAAIPLTQETAREKGRLAREAAALFAKDIQPNRVLDGMGIDEAIKAADFSDAAGNVGLLSGTLVIQRSLALMKFKYPLLSSITSDFSDAPGLLNQTENTRIVLSPAVQTYSTTLGTDGRPAGWSTASPALAVDVPVTLDTYYGVPLVFGIATLSSTLRDLFGEAAPMALYALGGAFVNKLIALMTPANFNAYKGITDTGGATTNNSANVTVQDSTLCYPGQIISGTGIPANSLVVSITNSTTIVISKKATATGSSLTLTFGTGHVPTTYTTYAKALADFSTASYGDLKAAFSQNEVPQEDRWAMLNSSYYGKLSMDPIFNFYAAMQKPELLTKGILPQVQGFESIDAPFLPSPVSGNSYTVGFAGHKAALVIKTRLPQQLSQSFAAAAPGSVTTVTDPNTGISVSLVQFWNLLTNAYEWRPEVMVGAAVGDRRAGLVISSQ